MAFQGTNFKADQPTRLARKTLKINHTDEQWRHVCRIVDKRDDYRCRACGRRVVQTLAVQHNRLERHHVIPRSLSGENRTSNVCLLCLDCHTDRHVTRTLTITGNANQRLSFEQGGKRWKG